MTENGGAGINVWDTVAGEVNVSNNMVEGGVGISVQNEVASGAVASMGANTVTKTTSEHPISYSGSNIPNNITGNTLKENASNQIYVAGKVVGSSTWGKGGASVALGEVVVEKEATLTISPGVVLCPGKIIVKGTLLAEGTTAEPISRCRRCRSRCCRRWKRKRPTPTTRPETG